MDDLALMGLLLGIFIFLLLITLVVRKRKGELPRYDERQLLLRGRAYRSAFLALVVYLLANGMFSLIAKTAWADAATSSFVGICLAVTVFVVACIKSDAYFPVNQKPRFYFGLFLFITLVNLATGVARLISDGDSLFTDGALNHNIMPLVIFAMFAAVLAALLIMRIRSRTHSETSGQ